jgi:hypothetical protein
VPDVTGAINACTSPAGRALWSPDGHASVIDGNRYARPGTDTGQDRTG